MTQTNYKRRWLRWIMPFLFIWLGLMIVSPQPAAAHPLGNFSINRYSRLELGDEQIQIIYVLDMAEIPTFQAQPQIDRNGDEQISDAEQADYLARLVATIQENLLLQVNGRSLPLTPQQQTISFPPGQGDLPTMRVEATFNASLRGQSWHVVYEDGNYANRLGWREIVLQPAESITLQQSTAPTQDISQGLTQYPEDLLQSPPAVTRVELRFETAVAGQNVTANVESGLASMAVDNGRFSSDRFAELITSDNSSPGLLIGVLLLAFGLGAAHALTPGHGKTIVGAYLVGSRGTAKHALFLGLTTTITHTAGVFAFGLLVLFASQFILPEQLYPWLGVLSGLLVVTIGFSLLRGRWRDWRSKPQTDHAQLEGYHTHFGIGHTHTPTTERVTWRNLLALGVSGGLLPCPSALVLLLSAIALQKVAFGLLLIVVFSFGLASVLTGIGLALVYAGQLFERLGVGNGRLAKVLPVFSALFITLAGLGITAQALIQTGAL